MLVLGAAVTTKDNPLVGDYIGVFFVSFVACFVLVPVMRWLATRHNIVDRPDTRKNHLEPVAYLGGVALFLGWLCGVAFSYLIKPVSFTSSGLTAEDFRFPVALIVGATTIMLTGLIDDTYGISPRVKIGGQFMAAAALAWSSQNLGIKLITDLFAAGGVTVPFLVAYILGAVLIAGFVVGGCNSMNLLDGLDGLAAGVCAIVCLGFLFISVYGGTDAQNPGVNRVLIVMCMAILGVVLGFLPYNFNPANIFMGDTGSMLLGYLCASTILLFAETPKNGPMLVTAALIVCALPLTDTFLTIFRRALQGQPLSKADKGHLHHKILAVIQQFVASPNLSIKLAVLVMYLLAAVFAVVGCSLVFLRWRYVLAVFIAVFGFILVGTYKSGRGLVSQEEIKTTDS